jgi:hypothetical protein
MKNWIDIILYQTFGFFFNMVCVMAVLRGDRSQGYEWWVQKLEKGTGRSVNLPVETEKMHENLSKDNWPLGRQSNTEQF